MTEPIQPGDWNIWTWVVDRWCKHLFEIFGEDWAAKLTTLSILPEIKKPSALQLKSASLGLKSGVDVDFCDGRRRSTSCKRVGCGSPGHVARLSSSRVYGLSSFSQRRQSMNSPQEPASPSASTPSSGSPPPEAELNAEPVASSVVPSTILDNRDSVRGPASQTKRRLPMGSSSTHGSRDSKARRRDDGGNAGKRGMGGGGMGTLGEGRDGRMKDELVDLDLMEKLKNGALNLGIVS